MVVIHNQSPHPGYLYAIRVPRARNYKLLADHNPCGQSIKQEEAEEEEEEEEEERHRERQRQRETERQRQTEG